MTEEKKTKKINKFIYGKGARKTATAQVRFFLKGKGEIKVNGKKFNEYFPEKKMQDNVLAPLKLTNHEQSVNLDIKVHSSGLLAQSVACRHGISRCLVKLNPEFKPVLKAEGYLTRDPRVKERKKPGLKRARRAPQWSKR